MESRRVSGGKLQMVKYLGYHIRYAVAPVTYTPGSMIIKFSLKKSALSRVIFSLCDNFHLACLSHAAHANHTGVHQLLNLLANVCVLEMLL